MDMKEHLRAQLSEAENLAKELEALKDLPDLLAKHDAAVHRLFHFIRKVEAPEKVVGKKEIFEPQMVEAAAFLVEVIADNLKVKLQLQEVKEKKGAEA